MKPIASRSPIVFFQVLSLVRVSVMYMYTAVFRRAFSYQANMDVRRTRRKRGRGGGTCHLLLFSVQLYPVVEKRQKYREGAQVGEDSAG